MRGITTWLSFFNYCNCSNWSFSAPTSGCCSVKRKRLAGSSNTLFSTPVATPPASPNGAWGRTQPGPSSGAMLARHLGGWSLSALARTTEGAASAQPFPRELRCPPSQAEDVALEDEWQETHRARRGAFREAADGQRPLSDKRGWNACLAAEDKHSFLW